MAAEAPGNFRLPIYFLVSSTHVGFGAKVLSLGFRKTFYQLDSATWEQDSGNAH